MKPFKIISTFAFLIVLTTMLLGNSLAIAQSDAQDSSAVEVPEALSSDAINALVSKLDSEQTEALSSLVELLGNSVNDGKTIPSSSVSSTIDALKQWIAGFGGTIVSYVVNTPEMIAGMGAGLVSIFDGRSGSGGVAIFLGLLALVIAAGIGAEWLYRRVFADKRNKIRNTKTDTLLETLKLLSLRAVIEVGGVVVFTLAALVIARLVFSDPTDQFVVSTLILKAIFTFRIVAAILHFILAPQRTDLRLVYTDDWSAKYTYRNFTMLACVVGVALFMLTIMEYNGIFVTDTLRFWISLLVHGWIIYVTWKTRKGLTSIIVGKEEDLTPGLERMANWWPPISMVIITFNWFLIQFIVSSGYQALTPARGALALLLIVTMPFLDTIVRGVATHLVAAMKGEGAVAEKAKKDTRLCYIRVGRVIVLATIIIIIGNLWGVNLRNFADGSLGAQFAANGVGFLLILAVGYMVWEITNLVINRKLMAELDVGDTGEESEAGGAGQSRMATILPILRMTLQTTIIIITVLLALGQLGVNTTPLLAGAGVLGLAIGFGAQTLVKDIVSGVFFLLDDAFRVGEYIDSGGTQGTVEKISVRSLQLRDTLGPIHIVPYGSMSKLTNMSRDWVIMKLKFTIPFDTDLETVRKLFKKIGQEMLEDPELADKFLEPFKGQGAADVTDTGIVVRGKFTTKPGDQWEIRKQVYNRVQKAFEEKGIEFARREVRVKLPQSEDTELTPKQKDTIAAAANEVAESPQKA